MRRSQSGVSTCFDRLDPSCENINLTYSQQYNNPGIVYRFQEHRQSGPPTTFARLNDEDIKGGDHKIIKRALPPPMVHLPPFRGRDDRRRFRRNDEWVGSVSSRSEGFWTPRFFQK